MADNVKLHVAMFPWLAFGHMIPFLELAKLIAKKGHRVSFISTAGNVRRLPKLPPHLSPLITFVKLPLPHGENLPENAEATIDLPLEKVKYLKLAYDALQEPMTHFLQSTRPDWLLYDFAPYWLPAVAREIGVPNAFFSIFTGACLGFIGKADGSDGRSKPEDYTVRPEWVRFPTTVAFRLFEVLRIFDDGHVGNDENVPDFYRFGTVLKGCDIIAIRSCTEIESEWLEVMHEVHRKPVIPVGQLPTTAYDTGDDNDTWRWMKEWLDKQKEKSVVYVAFGSEAKPSQEELTEIALGLELSELPFFWVVRTRCGEADTESTELPKGFEERTKGRGVVCTSWIPQLKLLAHNSVGGFLTHSGWSSVVEAFQFERPLILLTFFADQGLNASFLREKKMGYLIPRNESDGSFTRDSVADSLKLVVTEEAGKFYRDKAREMKGVFGDREIQDRYVDNFLGYLVQSKTTKNGHLIS